LKEKELKSSSADDKQHIGAPPPIRLLYCCFPNCYASMSNS